MFCGFIFSVFRSFKLNQAYYNVTASYVCYCKVKKQSHFYITYEWEYISKIKPKIRKGITKNRHQDNLIYGTLKRIKGNCAGMF